MLRRAIVKNMEQLMMHYRTKAALAVLCFTLTIPAHAEKFTRDELERQFQYGWSRAAEVIVYGTVASVDYKDDPRERNAYAEITIRVDSVQRGIPGDSMIRVKIEDELQTEYWNGDVRRVGEAGMWFLHRYRATAGRLPRGYLVRYMPREEVDSDPQYAGELLGFVIRETIDKAVPPTILRLLSGQRDEKENASLTLGLDYNEDGELTNLKLLARSGNPIFDDHTLDTVLNMHRRLRFPGPIRHTEVTINRTAD